MFKYQIVINEKPSLTGLGFQKKAIGGVNCSQLIDFQDTVYYW